MADPPRFEHGFTSSAAHVISRLHYGSNMQSISEFGIMSTVIRDSVEVVFSTSIRLTFWHSVLFSDSDFYGLNAVHARHAKLDPQFDQPVSLSNDILLVAQFDICWFY